MIHVYTYYILNYCTNAYLKRASIILYRDDFILVRAVSRNRVACKSSFAINRANRFDRLVN